jgi:hypothetical protein
MLLFCSTVLVKFSCNGLRSTSFRGGCLKVTKTKNKIVSARILFLSTAIYFVIKTALFSFPCSVLLLFSVPLTNYSISLYYKAHLETTNNKKQRENKKGNDTSYRLLSRLAERG